MLLPLILINFTSKLYKSIRDLTFDVSRAAMFAVLVLVDSMTSKEYTFVPISGISIRSGPTILPRKEGLSCTRSRMAS